LSGPGVDVAGVGGGRNGTWLKLSPPSGTKCVEPPRGSKKQKKDSGDNTEISRRARFEQQTTEINNRLMAQG